MEGRTYTCKIGHFITLVASGLNFLSEEERVFSLRLPEFCSLTHTSQVIQDCLQYYVIAEGKTANVTLYYFYRGIASNKYTDST